MADDIVVLLEKAAKLSRIQTTPTELAALSTKAQKIFAAFDKLSTVDTQNLEPLYTFKAAIELRADTAMEALDPKALLSIAPEFESDHFVVPRAVGGDDVI